MTLLAAYARLLDRLLAELQAEYGDRLVAVAVFGSVGRGTPRHDSDVDVLIVARNLPDGRFARVEEFPPAERRLGDAPRIVSDQPPVLIAPIFKTPEELEYGSPLFLDMVEDARILYDPDGVLPAAWSDCASACGSSVRGGSGWGTRGTGTSSRTSSQAM